MDGLPSIDLKGGFFGENRVLEHQFNSHAESKIARKWEKAFGVWSSDVVEDIEDAKAPSVGEQVRYELEQQCAFGITSTRMGARKPPQARRGHSACARRALFLDRAGGYAVDAGRLAFTP
jgi:hypothetical protein